MKIKIRFSFWEPYSYEISKRNKIYSLSHILLKTMEMVKLNEKTIQDPSYKNKLKKDTANIEVPLQIKIGVAINVSL